MPIFDGAPALTQFRLEASGDILHFIFDMPDRSMNVFSNKAIHELDAFATWLKSANVKGVVIRSGKESAFCAGADLTELGVAYDMIIAARSEDRFDIAFDHFVPLSRAIRKLERAGKPVAAAIGGLALGGGCELTLGAHYRVLADSPSAAFGLPESLVGLFPGAGGTQRLPRLVGIDVAIPVLLDGARLSGEDALKVGLISEIASPGTEVECAERWVKNAGEVRQPWDETDFVSPAVLDVSKKLAPIRERILSQTLGHYPSPLAILDCIEQGLPQSFDAAIRTEMSIFSHLIQRREPKNMIQTMFLAKGAYERAKKKNSVPETVSAAVKAIAVHIAAHKESTALSRAGFWPSEDPVEPVQSRIAEDYWFQSSSDPQAIEARELIYRIVAAARIAATDLSEDEKRMADYAIVKEGGFPAYLGGPFSLAEELEV